MRPLHDADVIVLGAGPAGSAAAVRCAQSGLRVILIERQRFPRHRPGETLHPGAEPLLRQLGVWEQVAGRHDLRHEGIRVQWGQDRRFEPFGRDQDGPWRGFQILRADLDALLLRRAQAVGVQVLQPCRALSPQIEAGVVIGVTTDQGPLRAARVVDATGSSQWLAHRQRLLIERRSPPLSARYGYMQGECAAHDDAPSIAGDAHGWTWIARTSPGLYQWTRLWFDARNMDCNWRPAELRSLTPLGPVRGADVTWRIAAAPSGPGYYLVGDAASTLDPASSHGVLKALASGLFVGHCLAKIEGGEIDPDRATRAYTEWLRRLFEHDAAKLSGLYALLHPSWLCAPPHLFAQKPPQVLGLDAISVESV